jgi:hypothetical protein
MSPVRPHERQRFSRLRPSRHQKQVLLMGVVLTICLGLLVLFTGCVQNPGGNTTLGSNAANQPSNRAANNSAPARPSPSPSAPAYVSGGLGLDRADWERSHGEGRPDSPSSPMFFAYEGGTFQVRFSEIRSGNVSYIERVWGHRNALPVEDARKASKQFIPADAKFVKTYTSQGGSTVDLYKSESLQDRFKDNEWTGGKPGDFIILYRNQTGRTTTFIAATGNNP